MKEFGLPAMIWGICRPMSASEHTTRVLVPFAKHMVSVEEIWRAAPLTSSRLDYEGN